MPGVVDIPQGAWYNPDKNGVDLGGNINVLTSEKWTALAKGNAQHTIMVEVEKYNNRIFESAQAYSESHSSIS